MSGENKGVKLEYTKKEWEIIGLFMAKEFHSNDNLHDWLRKKISLIPNEIPILDLAEDCIPCQKKAVIHTIPAYLVPTIELIAKQRCTNVTRLLSRHIIDPALRKYYEEYGFA